NIIDLENSLSFSEKIQKFRSYLTKLKTILNEEESKVENLSALQQEVKQLTTNKQNIKEKMNTLIETEGDKDEEKFFDLYKKKKIQKIRNYIKKIKTNINEEESKVENLSTLKQEVKQLTNNKQNIKEKMNTLIETAGVKDEATFFDLYKQKEALDAKKSRLSFLKENAPSFNEEKELPTKEALDKKEEQLREELQKLVEKNKAAVRESANTQLSIERLEEDGTYTEELQHFENQKATAQRLADEWVSNKIAAGMIRETLNQVTQDRFEEIIFDAETYFHLLTNEEYEK